MTIQELYERLEIMMKANPRCKDFEIGIADKNFRGVGGTPIIKLKSINNGHDWNYGRAFMSFDENPTNVDLNS